MNDIAIRHSRMRNRFETEVDGHAGYVEYALEGGTMAIVHAIVPEAIGGRGIAGQLVRAAVEHAQAEGLKVAPRCSYAATWMDRHPEFAGLRV
jgi:predicted GNAT family acetyltransferase